MITRASLGLLFFLLPVFAACPSAGWAQVDQKALARTILGDDARAAMGAVGQVQAALVTEEVGPELRAALITVLERQNQAFLTYKKMMASGVVDGLEDLAAFPPEMRKFWGESYRLLFETVIALRDPHAIPALVGAVGNGNPVHLALAEFGEDAAPALLRIAEGEAKEEFQAAMAMRSLTLMIEDTRGAALSPGTLERVLRLAQGQLSSEMRYDSLIYFSPSGQSYRLQEAVSLALVLGDPSLRALVTSIARDRGALRHLGVEDSGVMDGVLHHAAEALAKQPIRR